MSLPNLKDKIEGRVSVNSGRSGVRESPAEILEMVETEETVPEHKLKGRKIKKQKENKK